MPDHTHACLNIPKCGAWQVIGFLKGKSAVRSHCSLLGERRLTGLRFWAR